MDLDRVRMILEENFEEYTVSIMLKNYKRYGRHVKFETNKEYIVLDLNYNIMEIKNNDSE